MSIVKTYDPSCYELAEHFLQDEPCSNDPDLFKKHCHSMALEIQQAVEDWFFVDAMDDAALPTAQDVRGIFSPVCSPTEGK